MLTRFGMIFMFRIKPAQKNFEQKNQLKIHQTVVQKSFQILKIKEIIKNPQFFFNYILFFLIIPYQFFLTNFLKKLQTFVTISRFYFFLQIFHFIKKTKEDWQKRIFPIKNFLFWGKRIKFNSGELGISTINTYFLIQKMIFNFRKENGFYFIWILHFCFSCELKKSLRKKNYFTNIFIKIKKLKQKNIWKKKLSC